MTEPYHIPNSLDSGTSPQRLENILKALRSYHEHVLQTNTLQSQSPVDIDRIQQLLRMKSKDIKSSIDTIYKEPTITPDQKYNECILTLRQNLLPWSPEYSTLAKYWCEIMFETHPFTLSKEHIYNLLKNSDYIDNETPHKEMPEGLPLEKGVYT